ncbi:MAG TPA: nucleoside-diphosphate sugar epimerase/dehydratase [Gemmatimonadaceae bacterium]|nr:nucleoside-diphosphate sugar epimerase/dehydratase [Gemmatimonadaceae bacterium]
MRNRYLLALDLPILAICVFLAFGLRFDLMFIEQDTIALLFKWSLVAALLVKPPIFLAFGLYNRYWRYASVGDLLAIALAVSASTLALAVVFVMGMLLEAVDSFPRSVLLGDWLLTMAAVGGIRLSVRVLSEARRAGVARRSTDASRRVLLVGAGQAGTMMAREIGRNPQLCMDAVGFVDDDPVKVGKQVLGLPVFGGLEALPEVLDSRRIDEVIIAMPTAAGTALRKIAERCREAGVPSRTMPGVFELLNGVVSVSRLRKIDIADLLRRSQVAPDSHADRYLRGRTVLVTGAGGSIGLELCRQVAAAGPQGLILVGHGENSIFDADVQLRQLFPGLPIRSVIADIRDEPRVDEIIAQYTPAVVFHAAAHKHVPLMEDNPSEAISNNVFGTANVVRASLRHGVERFVLISTDKAVAPTSVMGVSKRLAEGIVRDAATRSGRAFVSVRFGNVLGSRGSVLPQFKRQIEAGGPITITHPDMRRFFMTIPEAVHLVLQAGGLATGGELFVLDMGEPVRIADLAEDLIKLSGCSPDEIPIVYTGIRPGEKLTETLWEDGARIEPTAHSEVLRVEEHVQPMDVPLLLSDLRRAVQRDDRIGLEAVLVKWVETFAPPPDSAARRSPSQVPSRT